MGGGGKEVVNKLREDPEMDEDTNTINCYIQKEADWISGWHSTKPQDGNMWITPFSHPWQESTLRTSVYDKS